MVYDHSAPSILFVIISTALSSVPLLGRGQNHPAGGRDAQERSYLSCPLQGAWSLQGYRRALCAVLTWRHSVFSHHVS